MRGTLHLKRRFPAARLVAFSSSSAELGVVGQATYGAANAFLDEICAGDAVQWGGWGDVGMAADHGIEPLAGERFLAPSRGLELLGLLIDSKRKAPTLVLDVDWPQARREENAAEEHTQRQRQRQWRQWWSQVAPVASSTQRIHPCLAPPTAVPDQHHRLW